MSLEVTRRWVSRYDGDGFATTPLSPATSPEKGHNGKAPRLPGWQVETGFGPGEWRENEGIGLLTGKIGFRGKGYLTCGDIDSREALRFADFFMPETGLIGGRAAKPRSNRFYLCDADPGNIQFTGVGGVIHAELIGTDHQIVVAPTLVIDKQGNIERKAWDSYSAPLKTRSDELLASVTKLAVVAEISRFWPTSGRHSISLPVVGGLLRAGWSVDEVSWTIDALGWETQQKDEIYNIVSATYDKLEKGDAKVSGWPSVIKELPEAEKHVEVIIRWLKANTDDRPAVDVRAGQMSSAAETAWKILAEANDPVRLVNFGGSPVRIEGGWTEGMVSIESSYEDSPPATVTQLTSDRLRYHVSKEMAWFRRTEKGRSPIDPPADIVAMMLAMGSNSLPSLKRIVTAPVFSPSGQLQTTTGYHPDSKTFYSPVSALTIPTVTQKPDISSLQRAKSLLLDEFMVDFPFANQSDRAHAVAYTLLPFVRDMVNGPTPMHIFDASMQASGKTKLVTLASSIFTGGRGAMPMPFPTQEEEMVKTLGTVLNEGATHIFMDNVVGRISSPSLAAALTGTNFRVRRLGSNDSLEPPIYCAWAITANNARGDADFIRRSINIRLVPQVEHPHLIPTDRWKHYPLDEWVFSHRGELIWACLTLVQHWINSGANRSRAAFGDYGAWAGVIGGILTAAGIPGFLENITDYQMATNEEREGWVTFYELIWNRYGPNPFMSQDVVQLALDSNIYMKTNFHDQQKRELGTLMKGKVDAIHAGFKLEFLGKTDGRTLRNGYRLIPMEGQAWTPPSNIRQMATGGSNQGSTAANTKNSEGMESFSPESGLIKLNVSL